MTLLEAYNVPFAAALLLMLLLAIMQAVGLGDLLGAADGEIDVDLDADGNGDGAAQGGMLDGLASLLGIGRVPLMAWLAVYLFVFAGTGIGLQALADSLLGAPLERWLAALIVAGLALPVTGALVRPLAAILPRDRTTAVSLDTLVGRRATVTDGVAQLGSPARAKVIDQHGQPHFVMVEPLDAGDRFPAGQEVLLVESDGPNFRATATNSRSLARN